MNDTRRISSLARLALVLLVALGGAWQLSAATTYYISWNSGNDSNNGTSKSTPWKRHPWMRGFGGSYTHVAGNDFVFKGGETWTAQDCLTLSINGSGTASDKTSLGVDQTWFTGASWTKPKFDAQGQEFNILPDGRGFCVMILIAATAPQHDIVIDNIDFTGLYWKATVRPQGWICYITIGTSTNITISNCNFRNWTHAPKTVANAIEDQLICILGYNQPPYTAGCIIDNCLFDGENQANRFAGVSSCQAAVFAWGGKIRNCIIRNTAGGLFPSGAPAGTLTEITGCTIGPMFISYDAMAHHDAIQDNGGAGLIMANNYIFDIDPVPVFLGAGWGGGTYYVYNNVIDTRSQTSQTPITFDAQSGGNTFFIYNNTIIAGPDRAIFRANWRPTGGNTITKIDMRNNHFIGEGVTLTVDSGVTIGQTIDQNNVKQAYTAALNAGYQRANQFQPTSLGSPTVGQGQALASFQSGALLRDLRNVPRPQFTTWDSGAYEFTSGATFPGAISFASASYGANSTDASVTLTLQRTGGSSGAISANWFTQNGTATAGVDYTTSSGVASFADGVTTPVDIVVPLLNPGLTGGSRSFTVGISGSFIGSPATATVTLTQPPTPPPLGTARWAVSAYQVPEAGPSITVTAQRVGGTNGVLTANFATVPGSATAGHDYASASGSFSWPSGDSSDKSAVITIINSGDTPGTNRTFTVNLSGSAVSPPTTTTVTILMESPPPPPPPPGLIQWSLTSYQVSEAGPSLTVTAQRYSGTNAALSVSYATSSGTAIAGHDYTAVSGNLSWAPGDAADKTVVIPIIDSGDTATTNRTFSINLNGASVGTNNIANITIVMRPPVPPLPAGGTIQWVAGNYAVNEDGGSVTLMANRLGGTNGLLTANYSTVASSAVAGHDYTAASGTLSWADGTAGALPVTITILDSGDTPGTNRVFTVPLTGSAIGTPGTATVTIAMRSPPPPPPDPVTSPGVIRFQSPSYFTSETNATVNVFVQRLNGTNSTVSAQFSTASGSAAAGTDFTPTSGTLSWGPNDNGTKQIIVTIKNTGTVSVLPRTFTVSLSSPTGGAAIGTPATATVFIAMNAPISIRAIIGNAVLGNAIIGR